MEEAFAHHVWATLRLVDACLALSPQHLETAVPGTYGSILDTLRHLIGSDAWDLFVATGDRASLIDEADMHLSELRAAMESHGPAWSSLLAQDLDPDAVLNEVDEDDGYERSITMGFQLAGVLQHDGDRARAGSASRLRSPEPGLHRPHGARRGTAGHRCLGLRPPGGPGRGDHSHVLMSAYLWLARSMT